MRHPERLPRVLVALTLLVLFNCGGTVGCDGVFEEFRAAATTDLKAGVNSILDGVVDGVFAVFEPDDSDSSSSSSSSSSSN